LQSRSKSIQRALKAYNIAAALLIPPRPKLTWEQVVEYTTIAEFELLRSGAHEDIRNRDWADSRNREAGVCHLRLLRAREEIQRLNIEVRRLATWISDENHVLEAAVKETALSTPLLSAAIHAFAMRQKHINGTISIALQRIYSLPGFSGDHGIRHSGLGTEESTLCEVGDVNAAAVGLSDDDDNDMLDNIIDSIDRTVYDVVDS
jgi:hypothetical protein